MSERRIPAQAGGSLLRVEGLEIANAFSGALLVKGTSFEVHRGETVSLVGESGSGKSLTAKALLGLLPPGLWAQGSADLAGTQLIGCSGRTMRGLRGSSLGLLLQDPFTMLSPLTTIRTLLAESLPKSRGRHAPAKAAVDDEIGRRLSEVGLDPQVASRYPWEISGGMRQRVGLAAALAKDPAILIADEPTTALDATTQREVLLLLRSVQEARGMGLLLITHDLRVAFSLSDRILVMCDGEVVEEGPSSELRENAQSAYTQRLLGAELPLTYRRADVRWGASDLSNADMSTIPTSEESPSSDPLLSVRGLGKVFGSRASSKISVGRRQAMSSHALRDVSFDLFAGTNVGIIGESGSGKTTLARSILGLEEPSEGSIEIAGLELAQFKRLDRVEKRRARHLVQCVYQDPYSSLNPSHRIEFILREAIQMRDGSLRKASATDDEVRQLLEQVGLPADFGGRRPSTLSGGQRQRVAIARALAMKPQVLICDEPVAALDTSVQAQVLHVLREVSASGITLLFITHDLPVVRQMTDRLVVLFKGEVVETGSTSEVLDAPQHAYTQRLLAAVPSGKRDWLAG